MIWIIFAIAIIIIPILIKPRDSKEQKERAKHREEEQTNPSYQKKFEEIIKNKYTKEIANKVLTNQMEIGMTEIMFDEMNEYQYYMGKHSLKNEYLHRKHEVMKTKTKTIRRRGRRRYSGETEYIFNDGVLVKIITT